MIASENDEKRKGQSNKERKSKQTATTTQQEGE